jgi:DNA primase
MLAAGRVYFGDAGHFDFFRDRIMFPIHDAQGKGIAFGGRTLGQGQNLPKYINSSESIIFKKSETVYGLHLAKRTIAEKGYALITEGYLDTIVCHQFGFQNTIAPLGTALTAGHLKKIRRFTDKVVFVFDGDSAGIAAARRSLDLAFAEGFMVKIAVLPKGEDPDTFLRTHGESAMRRILGAALSPVRFLLRLHARNKLDGVRAALKLLVTCPDGLIRDEAIRELSDSARISEAILRDEMKGIMRTSFKTAHGLSRAVTGTSSSALHAATKNPEEEVLLAVALAVPEQCGKILDRLEIDSIEDATIRKIITKMATFISHGSTATDVQKLLVESSPDERSLMTRLMMIYPVDQEYADRTVKDCLHRIALRTITKKIQEAEAIQDTRLVAALIAEKSRLVRAEKRED